MGAAGAQGSIARSRSCPVPSMAIDGPISARDDFMRERTKSGGGWSGLACCRKNPTLLQHPPPLVSLLRAWLIAASRSAYTVTAAHDDTLR